LAPQLDDGTADDEAAHAAQCKNYDFHDEPLARLMNPEERTHDMFHVRGTPQARRLLNHKNTLACGVTTD